MKKYEYNYGKNPEGILSTISGYATETTNFGETAFGILNKSTRDKSNFTTPEVVSSSTATLFSVGNGTDHNSRKNIIELKADGSTFINGVGGYDGTNSDSATSLSDTLQNISSDIEGDYLPLTGGTLTGPLTGTSVGASLFVVGSTNILGNRHLTVTNIIDNNNYLTLQDSNNNLVNIGYNGITLPNKSSSDLLNAAGSTTSVSDIVTQVQAAIVDSAPETLDTLNELAAALGDDPNFATTITNQIALKADKTIATSSTDGLMGASDKAKLDQITITEGDIVASGFRITDGTANEVLTADGDSNTLKTINGQTLLGSGDVDMSGFATKGDVTELLTAVGSNTYEGSNYLTKEANLTDAVIQLDEEIKATNDNLALEHTNAEATYAKKTELAGKADAVHTHLIADVADLQSALDKKATKEELDAKISGTGVSSIQVVAALPDVQEEGVLYIVTGEEA